MSEFQEWLASLPEWRLVVHSATFAASPGHWERIAVRLDNTPGPGNKRLAKAIRDGLKRQKSPTMWTPRYEVLLRFRDGSIEKVRNAFIAYEEEKTT